MKQNFLLEEDISYINVTSNSFDFRKIENNIKVFKPSISTHCSTNTVTSN